MMVEKATPERTNKVTSPSPSPPPHWQNFHILLCLPVNVVIPQMVASGCIVKQHRFLEMDTISQNRHHPISSVSNGSSDLPPPSSRTAICYASIHPRKPYYPFLNAHHLRSIDSGTKKIPVPTTIGHQPLAVEGAV
mmetsp:Transcript_13780/g.29589  ORF Transcript_13780/g.29589 Transcript_13780/m.29589 type:complete len:136 (+) Transcript_13780:168-575(+)